MSPSTEHSFNVLSPRSNCVQCDDTAPPCPVCKHGYVCTLITQSCHQCATTKCIPDSSGSGGDSNSSGNSGSSSDNAGAIAGGVIGGVVFVVIATFLVWWFLIRKKRQEQVEQAGPEKGDASADVGQSRKSHHSIASTVLTRASNVIQIAYIPGVTNRTPPETPNSLVPPVPPLPGAAPDQHFFMPGDLRDSAWSGMSDSRSIAPSLRSSVATTIYRSNAIVSPMPAQQALRTRPSMVDVNGSNGARSPQPSHLAPPNAPAVPAITPAQLAKAGATKQNSSIVARPMMAKSVMVKGAQKNNGEQSTSPAAKIVEEQSKTDSAPAAQSVAGSELDQDKSAFDSSSSDEEDSPSSGAKGTKTTKVDPQTQPSIAATQSPFLDHPPTDATASGLEHQSDSSRSAQRHRKTASSGLLASSIDESRSSRNSTLSSRNDKVLSRVESPFSDANEMP